MDPIGLGAGYQGAKYAIDSLRALMSMKLEADVMAKVHEAFSRVTDVQQSLLNAREALLAKQTEIEELTRAIAAHDAWQARAAQYVLWQSPGKNFVMKFQGESVHFACPACFEAQRISLLQDKGLHSGEWECKPCNALYRVDAIRPYEQIQYRSEFYGGG